MLLTLSLSLITTTCPAAPVAAIAPPVKQESVLAQDTDPKAEYQRRRKAAEGDKDALWKLHDWCDAYALKNEARSVLRAIVKIDDDKKAHELLGDLYYEGEWFTSEKKLEAFKKKHLKDEAKRTGKVIWNGELVDPEDVPYLEQGMVRHEGKWIDAATVKKIEEGWTRQDLEWISPEELANVEKGLWKCGEKWLTTEEADRYHAEVGRWWVIPSDHFVLFSTCPRAASENAIKTMELGYREIPRALGRSPAEPVPVLLLNSVDQYGSFARGDAGVENPEVAGLSSVHGSFFAETWAEPIEKFGSGAGVAYWDSSSDSGNRFGEMFARHAATQSLIDAIDPSPKTIEAWSKGRFGNAPDRDFWDEKLLPRWFRYGLAAYAERYMIDSLVGAGGDPNWRRNWSVQNIRGGLDPLDRIFQFGISVDDPAQSGKLINEAGLLVAFVLDGKCAPVAAKHGALKAALRAGDAKAVEKAAEELAKEITANEAKLRAFAGI